MSSQSSHHPQEVLLAQFSLYVQKGGLKPDSFHFLFFSLAKHRSGTGLTSSCCMVVHELVKVFKITVWPTFVLTGVEILKMHCTPTAACSCLKTFQTKFHHMTSEKFDLENRFPWTKTKFICTAMKGSDDFSTFN